MKKLHIETIKKWSDKDAEAVLNYKHTIGRQAGIRLNLIKRMETLGETGKRALYGEYCKLLRAKVSAGGRVFGNMPSFD